MRTVNPRGPALCVLCRAALSAGLSSTELPVPSGAPRVAVRTSARQAPRPPPRSLLGKGVPVPATGAQPGFQGFYDALMARLATPEVRPLPHPLPLHPQPSRMVTEAVGVRGDLGDRPEAEALGRGSVFTGLGQEPSCPGQMFPDVGWRYRRLGLCTVPLPSPPRWKVTECPRPNRQPSVSRSAGQPGPGPGPGDGRGGGCSVSLVPRVPVSGLV